MPGLTSSQFDAIAVLANKGLCGKDLRQALAELHNIKLNRNQIGGILFRLRAANKVTVRPDKIRVVARRKHAPPSHPSQSVPRPVHAHAPGRQARFAPSPVFNQPETAPPTQATLAPLIERGPANLFDLKADSCKWPLWSDDAQPIHDKMFCNEAQHGEGPYCCAHASASLNRHDHPASIRNAGYVKKAYLD